MIYLLIPIFLYCISGMMDAVMDVLADHFSTSIFSNVKIFNQYFFNPILSWKDKYIDNDMLKGHKKIIIGFIAFNFPDALTDAWHVSKLIREGSNILAMVSLIIIPFTTVNIIIIVSFGLILSILRNNVFNLFWNKILKK